MGWSQACAADLFWTKRRAPTPTRTLLRAGLGGGGWRPSMEPHRRWI